MKILIDASCINKKNILASVPGYIFRLIDMFAAESGLELLVDYSMLQFFKEKYPRLIIYTIKRNYVLYRLPVFGEVYGRFVYKNAISKISHSVEIIPSDLDRCTNVHSSAKRIVIIYDLKAIKDGSFFERRRNFRFYDFLITNAAKVIAISEYTRRDLETLFNVPKFKIHVIYCSVNTPKQTFWNQQSPLPQKYLLYVNTLLPQKNILTLVKAFENIKQNISHHLVIVGKETSYWKREILPYINSHGLGDRIILFQNLPVENLWHLYKNASVFVTPSLREGFGYTPIEAALCKVPVICSRCEALPYSTQGLLNYYEPAKDYKALACKIDEVLNNPPSEQQLEKIAEKYKRDYSSERQLDLFKKVLHDIEE